MKTAEVLALLPRTLYAKVYVAFGRTVDWVPVKKHRLKALLHNTAADEEFEANLREPGILYLRHLGGGGLASGPPAE